LGAEVEQEDAEAPTSDPPVRMNDVRMPGWSDAWLLSAAPLREEEERLRNWSSCWALRPQSRWVAWRSRGGRREGRVFFTHSN